VKYAAAVIALALVPVAGAVPQPGPVDYGPLPTIAGFQPPTVSRIETRFSRAASLVSGGRQIEARCWSTSDWRRLNEEWTAVGITDPVIAYVNGYDPEPRTRIHLSPSICTLLGRLTYKREWQSSVRKLELARGVVTLAHEAQHIRGIDDEPTAECYGMQRARIVGRSLGMTLREANALVVLYWQRQYHRRPMFRSPECRQGGQLDLNLARAFP
jgi:hypothetical protein